MLFRNGYPNKFLDRYIQQFLNRKYGVTKQSDAPAEPSPSPKYISLQLPYLGSVSNNIRQEVNSFVRHKAVVNVKLRCFHSTQQLQSWFSIKDRQDLLNWFNVVYKPYVLMRCLLHQANAMKFNKSYRRASNVTKLFSMQTLASQPRSSGCLSQPWGRWQWQQLATAADSWIFIDFKNTNQSWMQTSRRCLYTFLTCNRASCFTYDVTSHHHRRVSSWVMWLRKLRTTTSLPKQPFAFFIFYSASVLNDQ